MNSEIILLVNEDDMIIGEVLREEKRDRDIHRVSALWVTNSEGEILLAKRHMSKKSHPGLWGPAVAGTNAVGESYESNIIKEAQEEIGLTGVTFQESKKISRFDANTRHFIQWFIVQLDWNISDFRLQENEVEEVRWWSPSELRKALEETPQLFIHSLPRYLEMFADL